MTAALGMEHDMNVKGSIARGIRFLTQRTTENEIAGMQLLILQTRVATDYLNTAK
jgi:hypothetical protein